MSGLIPDWEQHDVRGSFQNHGHPIPHSIIMLVCRAQQNYPSGSEDLGPSDGMSPLSAFAKVVASSVPLETSVVPSKLANSRAAAGPCFHTCGLPQKLHDIAISCETAIVLKTSLDL